MQTQSLTVRTGLRRTARYLGLFVLAWLILWAVLWLALPSLLKHQIERQGSQKLGRTVSVGQVEFRPWTLELAVTDLKIGGTAGAPPLLEIGRIAVDAELESLLRRAPVLDSLKLESPRLRLTHLGEGRYDIDDLIAALAPAPDAAPSEPARFALYNLELSGGSIDFDDRPARRVHEVRDLRIAVPFLSNLASSREVLVTPSLALRLNGAVLDAAAQAVPFAQVRKGEFRLKFAGLDLAPYLGYLPPRLPVRVLGGTLGVDLSLAFEQGSAHQVRLSGVVDGKALRLAQADGQELLAVESARVEAADVRPLERFVRLSSVAVQGPALSLRRNASGTLDAARAAHAAAGPRARAASAVPVASASGAASGAAPAASAPAAASWKMEVDRFALSAGRLAWTDESTRPRASLALRDITLEATSLSLSPDRSAGFQASARLGEAARLAVSGTASVDAGTATLALTRLPLGVAGPYLAAVLVPSLSGDLDARGSANWRLPAEGPVEAVVRLDELAADRVSLREGQQLLAGLARLQLNDLRLDIAQRKLSVAKLQLRAPQLAVERQADGRWMFERWLRQTPAGAAQGPGSRDPARADAAWTLALRELLLEGGQIGWRDHLPSSPVSAELTQLRLLARDLSWPLPAGGRTPRMWPLQVSARLAAGPDAGTLAWKGGIAPQPLSLEGDLEISRLPVHAFEPYLGGQLKVDLLHLDASLKAQLRMAYDAQGLRLKLTGDATLEDLRTNTVADAASGVVAEELLGWKALSVRGLDVGLAPGTPPVIEVRETALTDFFARLILSERGRLNLQDLVAPTAAPAGSGPAAAQSTAPTPAALAAGSTPPAAAASLAPVIRVGPVALVNGRVRFSDRFIKPNYTAELSELTGGLSAFSSVPAGGTPMLAELSLRGRAEGTASLEVTGKLNPLAQPLMLDIQGRVRDLELPPLTAYSVKYAGHGIERGKLSMDVHYQVQPDGQLQASNRLVLNQLRFGDPVQGAPASLPVRLAVALLADRNGVIDIDLPIRGSLNDPQFSIGPLIFKVVVNLIVKAVTAPFSLLASAFGGGGDELGVIAFEPGLAVLGPAAAQSLDKVASALQARPGLNMTVVGMASLELEREAFARARLAQWVLAEKRREAVVGGRDASAVGEVTAAEYPALLKAVYRRADMAKPRNLVGLLKDLPVPEMESLLLASVPVSGDDLRELALRRGVAVKDYLAAKGLAAQRLFLGAAKVVPPEAKWSPRAELSLAAP